MDSDSNSVVRDLPMKPAPAGPHVYRVNTPLPSLRCGACGAEVGALQGNRCGVCHAALALERSVLDEAAAIVDGARRDSYGDPAENHGRTAALWSAYLGVPITARQVCLLNVLQKVSRDAHRPGRDNLVDIVGYVRNAELVAGDA